MTELIVVEIQLQRLMEERWNPATTAVNDVDDAMLHNMLREIEELNEPRELSVEVEAILDDLLEELDLENKDQDEGDRSEFLEVEEVTLPCTGVYKVSVGGTCDVTEVICSSETDIEGEGKCFFPSTEVAAVMSDTTARTLMKLSPRPALTQRRRFWVPHRKH